MRTGAGRAIGVRGSQRSPTRRFYDCPQIFAEVRKAGGEPINLVNLSFGERTKLPHGKAAPHAFKNNEPATIEVRGTKRAYAAGIARSAVR
jgi:Xaa-Pro aminopeptidase